MFRTVHPTEGKNCGGRTVGNSTPSAEHLAPVNFDGDGADVDLAHPLTTIEAGPADA